VDFLSLHGASARAAVSKTRSAPRDTDQASPQLKDPSVIAPTTPVDYPEGVESPETVPLPADLDLRLVRYFTVVAEHRHFGRAAADLLIAQPSLSRQIVRLERQLGARLFDRTPQGTALTAAGEVFLPRARALLRAAAQAAAETKAAAQPSRITIGHTPGIIATPAVRLGCAISTPTPTCRCSSSTGTSRARRCSSIASTRSSPGCRWKPTACW
jgi:hypothetical protein